MTKNQALALLMEMHWNCKHYKGGYDDPKRDQKAEALTMAMTALKHWDIYDKMHDELTNILLEYTHFIVNASTGRAVGCPLHEVHNTAQAITVVVPKNTTVRIEAGENI